MFDDYDDIEFNATVGINGIFEYYTDFPAFDKLFQEDKTLLQKCLETLKKHPLFELIKFPIENVMKNTWDKERIKRYLRVSNADLNVYFCFKQTNVNEYESQTQMILKKKDGSFLATNILRVQKKNGVFAASGFGGINELNFFTTDTVLSAPSAFEGILEHTQMIQQDTNPSLENFVETDEPDITEGVAKERTVESQESQDYEVFQESDQTIINRENEENIDNKEKTKNLRKWSGFKIGLVVIACLVGAVSLGLIIKKVIFNK